MTMARSGTSSGSGLLSFGGWVNQQLRTAGVAHMASYDTYVTNFQKEQARKQASQLRGEYQTAYSEAKEANIKRYQEILAGYKTRYSTAMTGLKESRAEIMGGLEGLGEEELAGIGRRYTRERASTAQQLISSGLHSTTVAPAVQAGVTRREGYAMGEARERLRREKLGYLKQLSDRELLTQTGLTKEQLDFQERREDEYPSESLYVQLMQGLGGSS